MLDAIIRQLESIPSCPVLHQVPLKNLTTFRVGGMADMLVCPESRQAMAAALSLLDASEIPYVLLGRGSNTVFADEGCRAVIVSSVPGMGHIDLIDDTRVRADAGASLRAVAAFALEKGLPVYQPQTLRDEAFAALLAELDPEMIVVAAYGKILPKNVLDYPKYGCVNAHGSLLPKYRGAAPMQRAIINGDARFDAVRAREIYPKLNFLPNTQWGYSACLCGRACDVACYDHLIGGKKK